jgi:hypothetical protein
VDFEFGDAQLDVLRVVALQHLLYHVLPSLQDRPLLLQLVAVELQLHRLEPLQETAVRFEGHSELIPHLRARLSHQLVVLAKDEFWKYKAFLRNYFGFSYPPTQQFASR